MEILLDEEMGTVAFEKKKSSKDTVCFLHQCLPSIITCDGRTQKHMVESYVILKKEMLPPCSKKGCLSHCKEGRSEQKINKFSPCSLEGMMEICRSGTEYDSKETVKTWQHIGG